MIVLTALIEQNVRIFAHKEAEEVFRIWDADGPFMARRAEARSAIDRYAEELCAGLSGEEAKKAQAIGFFAFCDRYSALVAVWDEQLAFEAAAQGRAAGARRRRLHHVRSVFR